MDSKQRFETLITVESELAKRADNFGVLTLSKAERLYVLASWAKGALDCNGFAYFFLGPCNLPEVIEAFEQLGFQKAADAIRKAIEEFPDARPIGDSEELKRWVESQGERLASTWNRLCEPIWEITTEEFDEALTSFLRSRIDEFKLETNVSLLL